jgi:hypothetical protein
MSGEPVIFAPTRMKNWVRCPLYAKLLKEVEPIADWKPNMLLGRAMDAGLTHVYRTIFSLPEGRPVYSEDLHEQGLQLALETLREGYHENETWPIEGLEKIVERTYEAALKEHVMDAGPMIAVDESLGVGRPDIIQRSKDGSHLLVTDRKFTLKLEVTYLAKTLSEYEVDDQFWQYAWEAQQRWGIPVKWLRVHLLIGTPKPKSVLHPWPVDQDRLAFWLSGAEQNWRDMQEEQEGKRPVVPKWANCMGKYGRCPFHGWCHEPQQRELFYRPVEPKNSLVDY